MVMQILSPVSVYYISTHGNNTVGLTPCQTRTIHNQMQNIDLFKHFVLHFQTQLSIVTNCLENN